MNPDSTRIPTGTLQWPLPVAGTITSQFGHRVDPITGEVSSHTGTDIACAEGTPILAAADGIVTVANGLDSWGGSYGYYIQIDHGGGLETLYAHCSSICVTTGQQETTYILKFILMAFVGMRRLTLLYSKYLRLRILFSI